jgi:hypothetical protein
MFLHDDVAKLSIKVILGDCLCMLPDAAAVTRFLRGNGSNC